MLVLVLFGFAMLLLWVWIGSSILRGDARLIEGVDRIMDTHVEFGILTILMASVFWPMRRKVLRLMSWAYRKYCLGA